MFTQLNTFGKAVSPWPLKVSEPVEVLVHEATAAPSEVTAVGFIVGLIVGLDVVEKTQIKLITMMTIDKFKQFILNFFQSMKLLVVDDNWTTKNTILSDAINSKLKWRTLVWQTKVYFCLSQKTFPTSSYFMRHYKLLQDKRCQFYQYTVSKISPFPLLFKPQNSSFPLFFKKPKDKGVRENFLKKPFDFFWKPVWEENTWNLIST